MLDLQKASLLKRVSALILDAILLCILAVGFGSVISALVKFDSHTQAMYDCYDRYEARYGIDFDITQADYDALPQETKDLYLEANRALTQDEAAQQTYSIIISLSLMIVSLGVLLSQLVLEFIVPLLIGNGQTMGKRIFSIGVMRTNGVKINAVSLFTRTVLGKYAIGTMVPVLMLMMILMGTIGIVGPAVILGIGVLQVCCMIFTSTNSAVHDLLANTVVVDISSQMIFGSESELIDFKKRIHAEKAARRDP